MLNRSFTAVIERNMTFSEPFMTEPYETGWAKEARWFIRILSISEGAVLTVKPQLSPDGLFWCDAESDSLVISRAGTYTLPLKSNFGHWLALQGGIQGEAQGSSPQVKLIIYLALKE